MAERQSVKLPEKFLCRICARWKKKTQFSNKELGKFTFRNQNSSTQVTPITARLRCRGCTGEAAHELECLGPCGKAKLLNEFSKAARKAGGSNWCTVCTLWKESSEHNVSVQSPPISNAIGDSSEIRANLPPNLNDYEYSDPEAGDDDSDYDDMSHISSSTLSLGCTSGNTIDYESQTSSVSNRWENASFTSSASISTSTSTICKPMQPLVYNAWDPSGNLHKVNRTENLETNETKNLASGNKSKLFGSREINCIDQPEQSSRKNSWKTIQRKASDDLIDL